MYSTIAVDSCRHSNPHSHTHTHIPIHPHTVVECVYALTGCTVHCCRTESLLCSQSFPLLSSSLLSSSLLFFLLLFLTFFLLAYSFRHTHTPIQGEEQELCVFFAVATVVVAAALWLCSRCELHLLHSGATYAQLCNEINQFYALCFYLRAEIAQIRIIYRIICA